MNAATEFAAAKSDLSVEIARARARFWSAYPNGEDREAAESEFSKLLLAKDWSYLSIYAPQGPHAIRAKVAAGIGGQIDGGIPEAPRTFFYAWVFKIREALGATNHMADPAMGIKEPDIIVPTPAAILRALAQKDVQDAYDAYKIARDRAEFAAVGRQQEFDDMLLKSKGPVEVAAPTIEQVGNFTNIKYGAVPENFVPTIDRHPADSLSSIGYDMQKTLPGSLYRFSITPCCYYVPNYDPTNAIHWDDALLTRKEKAYVLGCSYLTDRSNAIDYRMYWYKFRPPSADPARLRSRAPNHGMLQVGEPRDTCPATFSEATKG